MRCIIGAAPASNTHSDHSQARARDEDLCVTCRSGRFRAPYLHLDRNSTAGEPEGYFSAHVQRISAGYTVFEGFKPLCYFACMWHATPRVSTGFDRICHQALFWCIQAASQWQLLPVCIVVAASCSHFTTGAKFNHQLIREGKKEMVENKDSLSEKGVSYGKAAPKMNNALCYERWERLMSEESYFPHKQSRVVSCFCYSFTLFSSTFSLRPSVVATRFNFSQDRLKDSWRAHTPPGQFPFFALCTLLT